MSERGLRPEPLGMPSRAADSLMRPLMVALGGFKPDSIQETHPWHVQTVDPDLVNPDLSVCVTGACEKIRGHKLFLFHAPIFGGWRNYTLFEAGQEEFHIGWVSRVNGELFQAAVNRMALTDGRVRMLNGSEGSETEFFAVSPEGEQVELHVAGSGVLGDNQFPDTRLL